MPKQLFTRSPRGRPRIPKSGSIILPARPLSSPHNTESAISKISPQFEGSVPNSFVEGRKQELQQQKVLTANGDPNGWHVLPIRPLSRERAGSQKCNG